MCNAVRGGEVHYPLVVNNLSKPLDMSAHTADHISTSQVTGRHSKVTVPGIYFFALYSFIFGVVIIMNAYCGFAFFNSVNPFGICTFIVTEPMNYSFVILPALFTKLQERVVYTGERVILNCKETTTTTWCTTHTTCACTPTTGKRWQGSRRYTNTCTHTTGKSR